VQPDFWHWKVGRGAGYLLSHGRSTGDGDAAMCKGHLGGIRGDLMRWTTNIKGLWVWRAITATSSRWEKQFPSDHLTLLELRTLNLGTSTFLLVTFLPHVKSGSCTARPLGSKCMCRANNFYPELN